MEGGLANILGTVAGLLSVSSFVPQVLKAWREGDTDAISKRMYMVTVTAFVLWTAYGFVLGSLVLIIFNALSLRPQRVDPGAQDPQRPGQGGVVTGNRQARARVESSTFLPCPRVPAPCCSIPNQPKPSSIRATRPNPPG
jgi:MtN3 and saliva related transmembrane protein